MNFLFLTTMMILIFMLTSLSMTGSLKTTASIARRLDSIVASKYDYENGKAKQKYHSSKKSKQRTNKEREEFRKGRIYSPRDIKPCENSKLNLYPLVGGNYNTEEKHLLKKTLESLIHEIYKNESFYIKEKRKNGNFLNDFVNHMVSGLQKEKSLAKTSFLQENDRRMFLMLCKGSYETPNIPNALLDYITLKKVESGPFLPFKSMPIPLLCAFFGEEVTKNILKGEEKVYFEGRAKARLTEGELKAHLKELEFEVYKKVLSFQDLRQNGNQEYIKAKGGALITLGPPQIDP